MSEPGHFHLSKPGSSAPCTFYPPAKKSGLGTDGQAPRRDEGSSLARYIKPMFQARLCLNPISFDFSEIIDDLPLWRTCQHQGPEAWQVGPVFVVRAIETRDPDRIPLPKQQAVQGLAGTRILCTQLDTHRTRLLPVLEVDNRSGHFTFTFAITPPGWPADVIIEASSTGYATAQGSNRMLLSLKQTGVQ